MGLANGWEGMEGRGGPYLLHWLDLLLLVLLVGMLGALPFGLGGALRGSGFVFLRRWGWRCRLRPCLRGSLLGVRRTWWALFCWW